MPYLRVHDRNFLLSPSDVFLPSCCALCLHSTFLTATVVVALLLPQVCDDLKIGQFFVWLWITVVVQATICLLSALNMYFSVKMKFLSRGERIRKILVLRAFLSLCEATLLIWGTVLLFVDGDECVASMPLANTLLCVTVIFNWISLFVGYAFAWCLATESREFRSEKCVQRLRALLCACFWEHRECNAGNIQDVLYSASCLYDEILLEKEGPMFTASDNFVGMQLLRMVQKFYHSKRQRLPGASLHRNKFNSSTELLLDSSFVDAQKSSTRTPLLQDDVPSISRKSGDPIVEACLRGTQPKLPSEDWNHIHDLQYYSRFAIGIYGLPLHLLDNLACGFCKNVPCYVPKGVNRDALFGKACCGNSSLKVFLRVTRLRGNDILGFYQESGLHNPTFAIVADRERQEIVITIRGTESLADTLTDLNAQNVPIKEIPGCTAHEGMVNSARRVFELIESNIFLSSHMRMHPYWKTTIVGHSLGAACGIVLSLLIREIGDPEKYRNVKCIAIAPPICLSKKFIQKYPEKVQHITGVVYHKDMIPRLSIRSLLKLKVQMRVLLPLSKKSNLWILNNSVRTTDEHALLALGQTSVYLSESGADRLEADVKMRMDKILERINETSLVGATEPMAQITRIYHILPSKDIENVGCCGRKDEFFAIYRADPKMFDEMLISHGMFTDHFPNLYEKILAKLEDHNSFAIPVEI